MVAEQGIDGMSDGHQGIDLFTKHDTRLPGIRFQAFGPDAVYFQHLVELRSREATDPPEIPPDGDDVPAATEDAEITIVEET